MLKLFNTVSRKKEVFKPQKQTVSLYTCGPTVHDLAHIGNLRSAIFSDLLRRTLEYNGYKVKQITNITDIEDKIFKRAKREKKNLYEITRPYTKLYLEDLKKLNIKKSAEYPTVTGHIKEIIKLIERLLKKGFAYQGKDGSIYFDISKSKGYGKLARLKKVDLKHGARVTSDEYNKENVGDFVLWKAKKKGELSWPSPFGAGRPGWHIECSALSMKYLGEHIDIHTGAVDLIFPHHVNEIAQSQAATGKKFVRYWVHAEHLLVNGRKMAKSLKNFYTLRDFEKHGFYTLVFRYFVMTAHYRSKLNFTWDGAVSAEHALDNLYQETARLGFIAKKERKRSWKHRSGVYEKRFLAALNDDLNLPRAIATTWAVVNDELLPAKRKRELLFKFDDVLGLDLRSADALTKTTKHIKSLVKSREEMRSNEQFVQADALRDKVERLGYTIEDTPYGPFLWPLKK